MCQITRKTDGSRENNLMRIQTATLFVLKAALSAHQFDALPPRDTKPLNANTKSVLAQALRIAVCVLA